MKFFISTWCLAAFFVSVGPVSGQNVRSEKGKIIADRRLEDPSTYDTFFDNGGRSQPRQWGAAPVPALPTTKPTVKPLIQYDLMYAPPSTPPVYAPPPTPHPVYVPPPIEYAPPPIEYAAPPTPPSYEPPPTPTMYGVPAPYAMPTKKPTRSPTLMPSSSPSQTPSGKPSPIPSVSPSRTPSAMPSANPTPLPSVAPSTKPSSTPSARPSKMPSSNPTTSSAPSKLPSSSPSMNPTAEPSFSLMPSDTPSLSAVPSEAPSGSEAPTLSLSPSVNPSKSIEPSLSPSVSMEPSLAPSESFQPSNKPSSSLEPSNAPSDQPSQNREITVTFERLRITLFGIDRLERNDRDIWQAVTALWIENFFSAGSFGFEGLDVSVEITTPRRLDEIEDGRILQRIRSFDVEFSVTVRMQVSSDDIEIGELAYLWLEGDENKFRYVRRLQRSENNRLREVTGVSDVSGPGLREPTAAPSISFEPTPVQQLLLVEDAFAFDLSMRLTGIGSFDDTNLTGIDSFDDTNLNLWIAATESYIGNFVNQKSLDFGVSDFETTLNVFDVQEGRAAVTISYLQRFKFRTDDQSKVPDLIQRLATLPFCSTRDRSNYINSLPQQLSSITGSAAVQGISYDCALGRDENSDLTVPDNFIYIPFQDLSLTLFGFEFGDGVGQRARFAWAFITNDFIQNFFNLAYQLRDLQVSVFVEDVIPQIGGVQIVFFLGITMPVPSPDIEIGELAYAWLKSAESRDAYLAVLLESGNNRLDDVTAVSEISGPGLPQIVPSAAPSQSFAPTELVPVKASIEKISMRLLGINVLNLADWRLVTRDFVEFYMRENRGDVDVFGLETDFLDIVLLEGRPSEVDVVVSYNQTFTFRTSDESKVPELVQLLSSLPFCDGIDREEYVRLYLKGARGTLANVVGSDRVQGSLFVCP